MTKIFIIHGAYGNPEENWFPWLKRALEEKGYQVVVPAFPTPENQSLDNWLAVFNQYFDDLDENTIFVGHSLGPAFILSTLQQINVRIKASFFVAGFVGLLNDDLDKINYTFTDRTFDWKKIKQNCQEFFVINSTNDPYIPINKAKELANLLDAKLEIVDGAGHFNAKAGYLKFPELFNQIKTVLDRTVRN